MKNEGTAVTASRKRLVFCFDGTWNRIDSRTPTNVVQTAASVLPLDGDGVAQVVYYDEGVGTGGLLDRIAGGLGGAGLTQNLADAYRFLIFNHTPGDEIFIFGFSRGAYTARSFVGLINNCGIVDRARVDRVNDAIEFYRSRNADTDPDGLKARQFRAELSLGCCVSTSEHAWRSANVVGYVPAPPVKIAYVGVWDTVGSLGVPRRYRLLSALVNRKFLFHDTGIADIVASARHAVALDEDRSDFEPSLWDGIHERNLASGRGGNPDEPFRQSWFPGTHSSVGGGGDFRGLSDSALGWIWDGARLAGLRLDTSPGSRIYQLAPDPAAPTDSVDWKSMGWWQRVKARMVDRAWRRSPRSGPDRIEDVSVPARRRWQADPEALPERTAYRPASLAATSALLGALPRLVFTPPPEGTFSWYEIMPGDQLGLLAQSLIGPHASSADIMALNADLIEDADRIYPGRAIRIPLADAASPAPQDVS